jgi:hypothetical protein
VFSITFSCIYTQNAHTHEVAMIKKAKFPADLSLKEQSLNDSLSKADSALSCLSAGHKPTITD